MRSMESSGRVSQVKTPVPSADARTPSISTSTWLLLLPRRKMDVCPPGPPVRAMSKPASSLSRSLMSRVALFSMSARVITLTSARVASSPCSNREAVTITSGCRIGSSASTEPPMAADRKHRERRNMKDSPNAHPRKPRRLHGTTSLVDIRPLMPVRCPPQRLEPVTPCDVSQWPVSGLASDAWHRPDRLPVQCTVAC